MTPARIASPRGEKVCCFTVLEIRNAASHLGLPSEAPLHQSVGWPTPFIARPSIRSWQYHLVVYSHNGFLLYILGFRHIQVLLPIPGRASSTGHRKS